LPKNHLKLEETQYSIVLVKKNFVNRNSNKIPSRQKSNLYSKRNHTHIRSNKVGSRKGQFTEKNLGEVEKRSEELWYNLSDFTIN
jgi:hypothetical protein